MKRFILLLIATILCMAACQKDNNVLRLEVEQYSNNSKVHIDWEHFAVWNDGDLVRINGETQPVSVSSNSATISIENTATNYYAIYPANIVEGTVSSNATITLPSVQNYRTVDGYQVLDAPMVAASEEGEKLKFHNLGSILALTIHNDYGEYDYETPIYIDRIEVIAENGVLLCGTAQVSGINTDNPTMNITSGSNVVTLKMNNESAGVYEQQSRTFYIALPVIENAKLSIRVYTRGVNESFIQSQANANTTFLRNTIHDVPYYIYGYNHTTQPPYNQIWYTTTNNNPITLLNVPSYGQSSLPNAGTYDASLGCYVIDFGYGNNAVVGDRAFENCSNLSTVTLPKSITSIGNYAFETCTNLISINIPDRVSSIGTSAFERCYKLAYITIPYSVTSIGMYAFSQCHALNSFVFENLYGCSTIGNHAFSYCESLTSITIPYHVGTIDECTFYGCTGLTNINFEGNVTTIKSSAFHDCESLSNISIPNSVTSIEGGAFSGCSSLINISIPSGVTRINNATFNGCSHLTNVSIPTGVTYIDSYSFSQCTSLTNITIPSTVSWINDRVFSGCSHLNTVNCLRSAAPVLMNTAFSGISSSAVLHVPRGCINNTYQGGKYSDWSRNFGGGIIDDL